MIAVIVAFLLFLMLFTLEVVSLSLVYTVQTKASSVGSEGFLGAFLMGAASGFVAAPCIGPVLVVILGIAGTTGSAFKGALLLFSYSMGLGLPFLVLGTFSGLLAKLPKSGNWLRVIKILIAICLFGVALFLIQGFFSDEFIKVQAFMHSLAGWIFLVISLSILWWGFPQDQKGLIVTGVVGTACSLYFSMLPAPQLALASKNTSVVVEVESLDASKSRAISENKIIMVDLFADWCAACKELEAITFPHPEVAESLKKLVAVRLNYDNETVSSELAEKYNVIGLPTILFLQPDGTEVPNSRITGFIPPKEFVLHITEMLKTASVK